MLVAASFCIVCGMDYSRVLDQDFQSWEKKNKKSSLELKINTFLFVVECRLLKIAANTACLVLSSSVCLVELIYHNFQGFAI